MASKSFIVGAGAASLSDVVNVVEGTAVAIDSSAASRVKKESPAPKQFNPEDVPKINRLPAVQYIPVECLKAGLFFKLNNLVNGKSKTRLAVCELLCSMLNETIIPSIGIVDTDASVMDSVADAMHGAGCTVHGESVAAAFEKSQIQPPGLSADERLILCDGQSVSSGIASLCYEGGKAMLAIGTFAAALSAEALKAEVKCFDTECTESYPLKYSVEVAETLKGMFEQTMQAVLKKNNKALPCIADVPSIHGFARMELESIALPVKAALAAVALPPHKSGQHAHFFSPGLSQSLSALSTAILKCCELSGERCTLVLQSLEGTEYATAASDLMKALGGLQQKCNELQAEKDVRSVDIIDIDSIKNVPTVPISLSAHSILLVYSELVGCELLAAMLSLHCAKASVPPPTDDSKKSRQDVFQLGKGTGAIITELEKILINESNDSLLNTLNLNGVPSSLANIPLALQTLKKKFSPFSKDLKSVLTSVNQVLEANATGRKPKIAKGARDFGPEQMAIREVAFKKIVDVFKRHGAVSIDTPVFELRETLMGKYGEDSKLIYDLADQGGEILSLRYDLTVPFARHVAVHGITNIKRYHIAKVYRRDQPQMSRGRYREFFQCDFDIAGVYAPMVPDAEVLKVLVEILDDLQLGEYEVKINHRKLLDAMLDIAGVPPQKFRPICSAIDKLDKEPWEAVKQEMVVDKGLPESVADKIGEFVVLRGKPRELLIKLREPANPLSQHPESSAALDDMTLLFDFLEVMEALGPFSFDLSLARGLDYYTGVIYEAVFKGGNVGSIAAGGRYDHLVGMFSGKEVPAVGVSIGIERVFAIMEAQMREKAEHSGGTIRETETEVLVASIGNGLQAERMKLASNLWKSGIKAEFGFKPNPKMGDQLGYALKSGIPLMVLFGEDEIKSGVLKLKDLDAQTETELTLDNLVPEIKKKLEIIGERRVVFKEA